MRLLEEPQGVTPRIKDSRARARAEKGKRALGPGRTDGRRAVAVRQVGSRALYGLVRGVNSMGTWAG